MVIPTKFRGLITKQIFLGLSEWICKTQSLWRLWKNCSLALQTKQEAQHLIGRCGYWRWYVAHKGRLLGLLYQLTR